MRIPQLQIVIEVFSFAVFFAIMDMLKIMVIV